MLFDITMFNILQIWDLKYAFGKPLARQSIQNLFVRILQLAQSVTGANIFGVYEIFVNFGPNPMLRPVPENPYKPNQKKVCFFERGFGEI